MALAQSDIPLTTRRVGGQVNVYPRLLRDRSMLPRIGIAIEHFESHLGHQRQELDPAVLVDFLGEPRLARCLVAALAPSYRFRAPELDEVVGPRLAGRLRRAGLDKPSALRLWLYD